MLVVMLYTSIYGVLHLREYTWLILKLGQLRVRHARDSACSMFPQRCMYTDDGTKKFEQEINTVAGIMGGKNTILSQAFYIMLLLAARICVLVRTIFTLAQFHLIYFLVYRRFSKILSNLRRLCAKGIEQAPVI